MKKYSIRRRGYRTSVSLESDFWNALQQIAKTQQVSGQKLISCIADNRESSANLSSAIRVFVMEYFQTSGSKDTVELKIEKNTKADP
jgi:predicted DNA-binding ribbon-helix-helix protein